MTTQGVAPRSWRVASDILWTTATTLAVMMAMLLVNGWLSRRGIADPFGTVNLAKRVAGVLVPIVMLGTSVGLVKMIAETSDAVVRARLRLAADAAVLLLLAAGCGVIVIASEPIARLSGLGSTDLLWATWLYVAAMALNGLSYAFARAVRDQSRANWINLGANAALPMLAILVAPDDAGGAWILGLMSAPAVFLHGIELTVVAVRDVRLLRGSMRTVGATGSQLISYSVPRCATALASAGMFAIGPLLAARSGASGAVPALLAALVLVQAVSAALQAVGVVTLPHAASLLPEGGVQELHSLTHRLVIAGFVVSAIGVPAAVFGAEDLLSLWLGSELASSAWIGRTVLLAVPAIVMHTLLRGILDAAVNYPWNTVAAVAGLGATAIVSVPWAHVEIQQIAAAFAAGVWVQGGITLLVVRRHFGLRITSRAAGVLIGVTIVVSVLSLLSGLLDTTPFARLLVLGIVALISGAWLVWPQSPMARAVWLDERRPCD